MNLAPVKGWEAHVGTKTTFNMANHFHVSKLAWPSKMVRRYHRARQGWNDSEKLRAFVGACV